MIRDLTVSPLQPLVPPTDVWCVVNFLNLNICILGGNTEVRSATLNNASQTSCLFNSVGHYESRQLPKTTMKVNTSLFACEV